MSLVHSFLVLVPTFVGRNPETTFLAITSHFILVTTQPLSIFFLHKKIKEKSRKLKFTYFYFHNATEHFLSPI